MNYKKSDYAINKYNKGVVYRSVIGEIITLTFEDFKLESPEISYE